MTWPKVLLENKLYFTLFFFKTIPKYLCNSSQDSHQRTIKFFCKEDSNSKPITTFLIFCSGIYIKITTFCQLFYMSPNLTTFGQCSTPHQILSSLSKNRFRNDITIRKRILYSQLQENELSTEMIMETSISPFQASKRCFVR